MTLMAAERSMAPDVEAGRPLSPRRDKSFFYRAYGLLIRSEMRLPELDAAKPGFADLTIRFDRIAWQTHIEGAMFELGDGCQRLAWDGVGYFLIRGTDEILIEPGDDVPERIIRLPLLGPVLAILLHLRGFLVLHASSVAVDGRGAVFLGHKRAGKSTTAAAMVAAGHPLLADDVVAIDLSGGNGGFILAGFPQVKLSPESAEAVNIVADVEPQISPFIDKQNHRLKGQFSQAATPLAKLYVLERGSEASIGPLGAAEAFASVIRFSYMTRFDGESLKGSAGARHFQQCASLAERVSRLQVPAGLDRIDRAVAMITADLAAT